MSIQMKRLSVLVCLAFWLNAWLWSRPLGAAFPDSAVPSVTSPAQNQSEARVLELGKPIERELAGGQSHAYQVTLTEGQYLNVVVEQHGIDVVVSLLSSDNKKLLEVDGPTGTTGQEVVAFVTDAAGNYLVEVRSLEKEAAAGKYEIKLVEMRNANANDRPLVEARKLANESLMLEVQGKYNEALPLAEKVLALREKVLGLEHPDVGAALNFLAGVYLDKGEFKRAQPMYLRVLAIREKALGKENLDVAESVNDLAVTYSFLGEYDWALPLYQRALDLYTKLLRPDDPQIAHALSNLAVPYQLKGDYAQTESLFRRALAIREKNFGAEHIEIANSLNHLATLYRDAGEYAKAEQFHLRGVAMREKLLGKEHPEVAESLNNLGLLYNEMGDYVKAEQLYQRAIEIREKALGPDHPFLATTLSNLAALYWDKGDLLKGEPLQLRAIAIKEKALGNEHPDLARSLNILAGFYRDTGNYAESEKLHQHALAMREKLLGEHPETALSLFSFAKLYQLEGKAEQAESLYKRSLVLLEKTVGSEHPFVVQAVNGLASLASSQGKYDEAEALYNRALKIEERTLNADAPDIARSLSSLASVAWAKGNSAQAIAFQSRASAVSERNIAFNLATGSGRQKLAYLTKYTSESNITVSLHLRAARTDPAARDLALTTVLQRKGRVLDAVSDSIAALRRRASPQDQALLDQYRNANAQLAKLVLGGPQKATSAEHQNRVKNLQVEVEKLEAEIARHSTEFAAQTRPVTLASIQSAIPADAALVEFFVYRPYNPKFTKVEEEFGQSRYVAYVLYPQDEAQWVELGEAKAIDAAVEKLRQALRDKRRRDVKLLARAVDEKVMRPVRALLGQTRRVLLSPDGVLNLIPFAALVDERNRYLIQRYSFSYLTSGRDLLRLQVKQPNKQTSMVVANPDFGVTVGNSKSQPRLRYQRANQFAMSESFMLANAYFPPLSGTAGEAQALKKILPDATVLTQAQATEAALKQVRSPQILHIATHGFFLEHKLSPLEETRMLVRIRLGDEIAPNIENPLLRSGLALAGANLHKSGDDDGILTALEVAGLDLWGTKLVVLSACDTGVGEVKNGDGVYGLRRALVLAGAESQVMSLWPVSDKATRDLMIAYYTALQQGEGRSEALRQVQLRMLSSQPRTQTGASRLLVHQNNPSSPAIKQERRRDYRHPYYWASFIQSGEWANLAGQR